MAKKPCSIDGKMVGFFERVGLKDGIICLDCARRLGIEKPFNEIKLLNDMSIETANSILNGDRKLVEVVAEHDRVLTQNAVRNLQEQSKKVDDHEKKLEKKQQAKAPHCPRCGSKNLQVLGNHRKAFSVGKAVVGGALTGGIGTLAGFAGKKSKKVDVICMNCGKKFKY